jgi:hypothetical protein
VGKTAGSTLACLIGFKYSCGEKLRIPKGYLPRFTTNVIHNDINDCKEDTPFYLFAVRNPLERIRSWFTYERPTSTKEFFYDLKKPLFVDCPFKTLNDLAELGLKSDGAASEECRDRADKAIRGVEMHMRHNYYNFGYFVGQTPPQAKILVIRTEHLEADWNSAEQALGGADHAVDAEFPQHNPSGPSDADRYLSPEAKSLLCNALCAEIQVYKDLLRRAVNLKPDEVQQSLEELSSSCPTQALASTCEPKKELKA